MPQSTAAYRNRKKSLLQVKMTTIPIILKSTYILVYQTNIIFIVVDKRAFAVVAGNETRRCAGPEVYVRSPTRQNVSAAQSRQKYSFGSNTQVLTRQAGKFE
jgi:hypothetical protein